MEDLTAFQRDILYVAAGMDEPPGLGIKAELDDYYEGDVNHGRLYPNLDDLIEKDLLEKRTHDQRTNSYTLTDEGHQSLQRRREWESRYVRDTERVDGSRP